MIDLERLVHSFKTGIACLLGFAIIKLMHNYLFFDQWLIVTILVVMCAQISVGSILFKSTIRLVGTTIGSLVAAGTIICFGDNPLIFALVIALTAMVFSYFATGEQSYSDAGTLGAVTTAIILINPSPSLALTGERFIEITLGIMVATLISQFILPIHARNHLRRNQAQTLKQLADYYRAVTSTPAATTEKLNELDEAIVDSLRDQHKLTKEAKRELLGTHLDAQVFKQITNIEKHILRGIAFLSRVYSDYANQLSPESQVQWQAFHVAMITALNDFALKLEKPETRVSVPSLPDAKDSPAVSYCLEHMLQQLDALQRDFKV